MAVCLPVFMSGVFVGDRKGSEGLYSMQGGGGLCVPVLYVFPPYQCVCVCVNVHCARVTV